MFEQSVTNLIAWAYKVRLLSEGHLTARSTRPPGPPLRKHGRSDEFIRIEAALRIRRDVF